MNVATMAPNPGTNFNSNDHLPPSGLPHWFCVLMTMNKWLGSSSPIERGNLTPCYLTCLGLVFQSFFGIGAGFVAAPPDDAFQPLSRPLVSCCHPQNRRVSLPNPLTSFHILPPPFFHSSTSIFHSSTSIFHFSIPTFHLTFSTVLIPFPTLRLPF